VSNIKTICQLSSLHFALDTRIFYKYARSLKENYRVIVVGIHPQKEQIEGVTILPFREYKSRLLRILSSWFWMYLKAMRIKADCYHIHDPELLPCALLLKWSGKKTIIDIHENIAEDIFDKDWLPFKKTIFFIYNKIERYVCKDIPVVLAESSYGKRYEKICKDLHYIHNYVEPQFFKSFRSAENERDPLHLYYIGIILESRCIIEIISAMHILHEKGIPVHFHCVGHLYHRMLNKIQAHVHYETLKKHLHFYGRMPLDRGYAVSQQCGIGLCLIKPMKNSIESKPTKLFEYMAIGMPILTSHFPLYKEIVEETETGITTDPESAEGIAAAIQTMLEKSEERKTFSRNGPLVSEQQFNWETERKKLIDLYEKVLKTGVKKII